MSLAQPRSKRPALVAAGACLPLLAGIYQLSAARIAEVTAPAGSWPAFAARLTATPWTAALLLSEAAAFLLWMRVLGELPLAVAFPLTALGSVVSLAAAACVLGEPVPPAAWIGTLAILAGAWLIVR